MYLLTSKYLINVVQVCCPSACLRTGVFAVLKLGVVAPYSATNPPKFSVVVIFLYACPAFLEKLHAKVNLTHVVRGLCATANKSRNK